MWRETGGGESRLGNDVGADRINDLGRLSPLLKRPYLFYLYGFSQTLQTAAFDAFPGYNFFCLARPSPGPLRIVFQTPAVYEPLSWHCMASFFAHVLDHPLLAHP